MFWVAVKAHLSSSCLLLHFLSWSFVTAFPICRSRSSGLANRVLADQQLGAATRLSRFLVRWLEVLKGVHLAWMHRTKLMRLLYNMFVVRLDQQGWH